MTTPTIEERLTGPWVAGIDVSLRATGLAAPDGGLHTIGASGTGVDTLATRATRLAWIAAAVADHLPPPLDLAVIEGPSYATGPQRGTHDRAGLWWLIVDALNARNIPVVEVPPATLKIYATGNGQAAKSDVRMGIYRTWGHDLADDNQADAFVLRAIGRALLGDTPLDLPARQTRALTGLADQTPAARAATP